MPDSVPTIRKPAVQHDFLNVAIYIIKNKHNLKNSRHVTGALLNLYLSILSVYCTNIPYL
jgi:hypothetical protein